MNIFVSAVICFFAVYGVMQLFLRFAAGLRPPGNIHTGDVYTVMAVRNQEESVEGMIRSAVWKALARQGGRTINDIVVLDLGSEDETRDILQRLEQEYDFVHVMSREDYIDAVKEY